jgi:hypothetical protein
MDRIQKFLKAKGLSINYRLLCYARHKIIHPKQAFVRFFLMKKPTKSTSGTPFLAASQAPDDTGQAL